MSLKSLKRTNDVLIFEEDIFDKSSIFQTNFKESCEYKRWSDATVFHYTFSEAFIEFFERFLPENNIKIHNVSVDKTTNDWQYIFKFKTQHDKLLFQLKFS